MVSFGAELSRLNLFELHTLAGALGIENAHTLARLQTITAILDVAFGKLTPSDPTGCIGDLAEGQRALAWEILRLNAMERSLRDDNVKVANCIYRNIPRSDLYGFLCGNMLVDDFANDLCEISQKLVDKYELRDGSCVGVTLKKNGSAREVQSVDLIPTTYFGYHPEWNKQEKIAPRESHMTIANEFSVARGGLTVLTGPERKKLAADILYQLENVFDLYAAVPFDEEYLRENDCWIPTVINPEAARLMYDRGARRAEAGMHCILYYDLDGGFPVLPYWGATRVGTLAMIVASKDPIPGANTVLYAASSMRKKGYVVDVARSSTNVVLRGKR